MSDAINVLDLVIIKLDNDNLKVGDVVTYKNGNSYITHRIKSINNNEIISIKQNQVMDKENLETIKNEILNVSTKSNDTKAIEKTDLNSKLNNYMLKINGVELVNLFWFYST